MGKFKSIFMAAFIMLNFSMASAYETTRNEALQLYQEGLFQETGTGDANLAIKLYSTLIKNYGQYRDIAAVALYHLGLIHEKKGSLSEAELFFKRIINDYKDQKILNKKAGIKLGAIAELEKDKSPEPKSQVKPKSPPKSFSGRQSGFGLGINYLGGHLRYLFSSQLQVEIRSQYREENLLIGSRGYYYLDSIVGKIQLLPYVGLEIDWIKNNNGEGYMAGEFLGLEYFISNHLSLGVDAGYYYQKQEKNNGQENNLQAVFNAAVSYMF